MKKLNSPKELREWVESLTETPDPGIEMSKREVRKFEVLMICIFLAVIAFAVCGCEEAQQRPFGSPNDPRWIERFGDDDIANVSYNVLKLDTFVAQNDRALFPKFRDPNDPQKTIALDRLATIEKRLAKLEEQTVKDGDKITTKGFGSEKTISKNK